MAVMLAHPVSVREGRDFKTDIKVIDFALNVNVGMRLEGNSGMFYMTPIKLLV
jgi:hypothetical protein